MIVCKYCGCKQNDVINTYHRTVTFMGSTIQIIKRRRVCRYCKLAFTTVEYPEDEEVKDMPDTSTPDKEEGRSSLKNPFL